MSSLAASLAAVLGADNVLIGDAIGDDYSHDEGLGPHGQMPIAVVRPYTVDVVCHTLAWASEHGIPVTARGAGTGFAAAATPGRTASSSRSNACSKSSRSTPITMSPSSTRA